MKLLSVVIGAVFAVAGCGSPDPGSEALESSSTSVEPTSTLARVEPPDDSEDTDGGQQGDVLHGPWLLVSGSVDEQPIPTEPDLVMRFGRTTLSFPLSCNSGSVPYDVSGTSIEFDLDHFSTTEEGCPDPNGQAQLFETGLRLVETATMSTDGQQLELEGPGVSMQFAADTAG